MFSNAKNPFDPARFAEMFTGGDFAKYFDASALKGVDPNALMDAQRKNMDALMAAQHAAAAGYQDLFDKQVAIFQETLEAAQGQIAELSKSAGAADAAEKQADLTRKAYETAVSNVTELTELAQKANSEAFDIVKERIETSLAEMNKT